MVRGQLTTSLLSTSSASLRASAPKLASRGGARPLRETSHLGYAAILSADGRLLAVSSGASPATARRLAARPRYVQQALSGRAWLSSIVPAAAVARELDWAVPFQSSAGRRVLVEGLPAATLSPFLSSFLSQGSAGRAIYVVDSSRRSLRRRRRRPQKGGRAFRGARAGERSLGAHDRGSLRRVGADRGLRLADRARPADRDAVFRITGARTWLLWASSCWRERSDSRA